MTNSTKRAIADLKTATSDMTQVIHEDVQTTLKSQTILYTASNQSLARLEQAMEALHRRIDELLLLLRAGCEIKE